MREQPSEVTNVISSLVQRQPCLWFEGKSSVNRFQDLRADAIRS